MNNVLELILKEWMASLRSKDRSKDNVTPNFEELFERLKSGGATREEVDAILPRAVKAHQPVASLIRSQHKRYKQMIPGYDKSEKEFTDEWNGSIEAKAIEASFVFFPIPKLDDDNEPKVYGNMSVKEYKSQRRAVDSIPILDTSELEKRMHDMEYNLDIEDMLKHVLGDESND